MTAILDQRLLGASSICYFGPTLCGVSCQDARRVLFLGLSAGLWSIVGDSGALPAEPGKLITSVGVMYAMTKDGVARSFTNNAGKPVPGFTTALSADTNAWIACLPSAGLIIAPYRTGGIAVLDGTSGAILAKMEGVLSRIAWATCEAASGTLICFDGMGGGAWLTIAAGPTITPGGTFSAPGTQGIIDGIIDQNGHLVIACTARQTVQTWTITPPTLLSGVDLARTADSPLTLTNVLDTSQAGPTSFVPLFLEQYPGDPQQAYGNIPAYPGALPCWPVPIAAGITLASNLLTCDARTARVDVS